MFTRTILRKTPAQILLGLIGVAAFSLFSATAHAVVIQGNIAASTEHTGSDFLATLTYTPSSATSATLTVDLTNTTPAAVGGFLTAFVMNNPDPAKITSISTFSTSASASNFQLLGLTNKGVNGAPFGQFDFGASTFASFEGGGNPDLGLGVGQSGTFTFTFSGHNLGTLNDQSFITALSTGPGLGEGAQFFVGRFRGLTPGTNDSDKVPGIPVPEPGTPMLLLAGLLVVGGIVARRARA